MDNGRSPAAVTLDLTATLVGSDGDDQPIRATLRYDLTDPYAVHATFATAMSREVSWVFARELLTHGVLAHAGQGDVRVWRSTEDEFSDVVYIGLVSPEGEALVQLSGTALASFLRKTYATCWPGEEPDHLDLDLTIEHLLAS